MDPNETLRILRALCVEADRYDTQPQADSEATVRRMAEMADEFATAFDALDTWFKGGGFIPDSWRLARKAGEPKPASLDISDPRHAPILAGIARYCRQHDIADVFAFLRDEVKGVGLDVYSCGMPPFHFVRGGMFHGIEADGSIHT